MPPSLDSKTEHYISTIAHRASLSRQRKATERSENARRSTAQPITDYHAYRKYTEWLYTDTSVFRTRSGGPLYKHHSHDSRVPLAILLLKKTHQNEAEYIIQLSSSLISNRFTRKPPRRGQPLYKGQLACPQCVLCLEVLLYMLHTWSHTD